MKYVTGAVFTRIILLMGLFSHHGIAINFGLQQFWACKCPPGFYALGTNEVFASAELCRDKNDSFIVGPNDFTGDITTPSKDTNGVYTTLEQCSKCAQGCITCKGPEAHDCLECGVGYFALPNQIETLGLHNSKSKRSLESTLDTVEIPQNQQSSRNPPKIFEEDELLMFDDHVKIAKVASTAYPSDFYPQISRKLTEDEMFDDFKNYDDEESSGEIFEDRNPLDFDFANIPAEINVDIKQTIAYENRKTELVTDPEIQGATSDDSFIVQGDQESSVVTPTSSWQRHSDNIRDDQHDFEPAVTIKANANNTHPKSSSGPPPKGNLTIENDEQMGEKDDINMAAMPASNLNDIFNAVDKDDEDLKNVDINPNESASASASTSENFDVISKIAKPPLQNLNKLNQEVASQTSTSNLDATLTYSCLPNCPDGHYNTSNRLCVICHAECEGCFNDGPTNCIKCRNYKKGSACVAACTSNATSTDKYNSNCELQSDDETILAGYYAVPPLVILLVCACLAISYYRKRRKLKNSLPGRPEGMHKTDMHSSESSFTRTHLDNKKCFNKGGKPTNHIALAEFKNSSETLKRKGNAYVYAERPLLPKYAHQTATQSPAWSACKDMSEPEDDYDPLYETPDNTMDLEALKRYHSRRRSSPSHVHFALTTSKVKEISNSLEGCLDTDSLRLEDNRDYDDVEDLSTENYDNHFGVDDGGQLRDIEAPYYQAPPLPVRNSPSVQDILIHDHIYVNIDENA